MKEGKSRAWIRLTLPYHFPWKILKVIIATATVVPIYFAFDFCEEDSCPCGEGVDLSDLFYHYLSDSEYFLLALIFQNLSENFQNDIFLFWQNSVIKELKQSEP